MLKKFLPFMVMFGLISINIFGQNHSFELQKDGSRTFREGELKIEQSVPFLTVKGDAYEMGLQYGVLANDLLVDMDYAVDSLIDVYIGKFFVKKWISNLVIHSRIKKLEKTMPVEYLQEFEGMADGSDLNLKDVKLLAYFPQLFFKISCTAFILKNETGIVHGRNLDWPGMEELVKYPLVVNYHQTSKIPVTVLTFMGYPGVYTGLNHNGLSMSINMNGTPAANDKDVKDYNTGMPLAFKLRNILENADELSEVDQMFQNYSSHAWFITVGSKKDNSGAVYELTRGEVIKNKMNNDFIYVENLSLSDKGRYQYSPIWMFSVSNISRERKINELYERIKTDDLISKSYQILTNTENHHLIHDPLYSYSINNAITIKSCIMDNQSNKVYFTYGDGLAAFNEYLKYDINTGNVSVYEHKKNIPNEDYYKEARKYHNWYTNEISVKKKLEQEDYQTLVTRIESLLLGPAHKALLLSYYYSQLENHELAFTNAEKYILELPDYYHTYYNKYRIMKKKGDYLEAIVALEEMLQTSSITPYYTYLAKINMIEMYDKLLGQKTDSVYIGKINRLADEIRDDLKQYFIDKRTQKDLDLIQSIENKYTK